MNEQLIIHATKTIEALRSILDSSSLKLAYSEEDFCIGTKKISSAAHPMVCFCRYDFKELDTKTIPYGEYGVAFSIDWALKKRISPVLYMDGNSLAAKGLATLLRARQNKLNEKLPDYLYLPIMEIKCFTKNVRGYNSHLKKKDFDFVNENEWRYVPVRRLYIFVEESVKKATEFVVFEPNDAKTWMRVKTMIENFLTSLWKKGALAGAKPEHAFFVKVGLGETMTYQDILNGIMNIEIGMAAVRPAEFIILKFSHKIVNA